jgi:hypothetical protein
VRLIKIPLGDLHEGNGLSDITEPKRKLSDPIFKQMKYDLLTVGNQELYNSTIALNTHNGLSKTYGDRYLASNVNITIDGSNVPFGARYRYFKTSNGLNIMAFGVIFDFAKANKNITVQKAKDMVKNEPWFASAVNYSKPIDLFVIIGHNPVKQKDEKDPSTLKVLHDAIRKVHKQVPILSFGGHSHIRYTTKFDNNSVALQSGKYCDTLGWLSMNGTKKSTRNFSRRYLDWNRRTFEYHTKNFRGSTPFDTLEGNAVTGEIYDKRKRLNLTKVYGCAPNTFCISCREYGKSPSSGSNDAKNIYHLMQDAAAATVKNTSRIHIPRLIVINRGSIRFDIHKGSFTEDDIYIVSPYESKFNFIQDVPYSKALKTIEKLLAASPPKVPHHGSRAVQGASPLTYWQTRMEALKQIPVVGQILGSSALTPGYTTTDDFGSDGDDTVHSKIPEFKQPAYTIANASFPKCQSPLKKVDFVFLDFLDQRVLAAFRDVGLGYTKKDIKLYAPESFRSRHVLPTYASQKWKTNVTSCELENWEL